MKEMFFNKVVFSNNGEMRYYYADGRISNLKLPQVFIGRGEPKDYSFYFSSFPLHGAGFYRIGDPSKQTGSYSCDFQFNISNVDVGLISNFVGVSSSIYAEGNKGLNLYIPLGITGLVYGKQMCDIGKEAYNNWPPSIENYYDFTTANIGFWGGPPGAMIGYTLDLYKRGTKWLATYYSELEMEL